MRKKCFGEYSAFNDDCDCCSELKRYCKMWKNNMFNFKRRQNLAMFICIIVIVAWNVKIGFDFLEADLKLPAILSFSAILLFFIALAKSIKSRKIAIEAYQEVIDEICCAHMPVCIKNVPNLN